MANNYFMYERCGKEIEDAIQSRSQRLSEIKDEKGLWDRQIARASLKGGIILTPAKVPITKREIERSLVYATSEMKLLNIEIQLLKCIRDAKPAALYEMYFNKAEEIRSALLEAMEESVKEGMLSEGVYLQNCKTMIEQRATMQDFCKAGEEILQANEQISI